MQHVVEAIPTLHASLIALGADGVLIRGAAGSGKSTLARRLVEEALAAGRYAAMVADDRVMVARAGGRLIGRPHPAIAGLVEARGVGVLAVPHEPAVVIGLVVDLTDDPERLPEPDVVLAGAPLRRVVWGARGAPPDALALALAALAARSRLVRKPAS